ncbi:MAG TPA: cell division protein FtsZ, partial [Nannocystaceae bacterium]|nr:cell division protein FtsZ [Nannocystaceae bacterium]
VDTLITIPNDRLLDVTSNSTSLLESFKLADEVLQHATQGVSDLITIPGIINVDFADVRTIMSGQGRALMGMGFATDEGRAVAAAQQAINSPLLEDVTIHGARGILINITAGPDLKLHEVEEAASLIQEAAHEDCNIIFGAVIDEHMGEALRITVIATGFDQHMPAQDELEEIIRGHSGRRRQSQMVVAGAVGPGGRKEVVTAPMGTMNTRQAGLFSSAQLAAQQAQQAQQAHAAARAHAAAAHGGSVLRGAAPEPHRPPHAAERTASWSRGDLANDPSEIPAFLRRRDENSGASR